MEENIPGFRLCGHRRQRVKDRRRRGTKDWLHKLQVLSAVSVPSHVHPIRIVQDIL